MPAQIEPHYSLALQEVDITLAGISSEPGVIDPGSQIVVIRQDLAQEIKAPVNLARRLEMEGANGVSNWTVGCTEYLPMRISDISFSLHAHVVEHAPFRLLLGRPFQHMLKAHLEDLPDGTFHMSICDPSNTQRRIYIPSKPRKAHVASLRILSCASITASPLYLAYQPTLTPTPPPTDLLAASLAYKKVAKKVRPVPASLPEDFRNVRRIPVNPLLSLAPLPTLPPPFTPGEHLSQEHLDDLDLNRYAFLWPEELKLLEHILQINEFGLV